MDYDLIIALLTHLGVGLFSFGLGLIVGSDKR